MQTAIMRSQTTPPTFHICEVMSLYNWERTCEVVVHTPMLAFALWMVADVWTTIIRGGWAKEFCCTWPPTAIPPPSSMQESYLWCNIFWSVQNLGCSRTILPTHVSRCVIQANEWWVTFRLLHLGPDRYPTTELNEGELYTVQKFLECSESWMQ